MENWRAGWWDHTSAFYGSAVEMAYEGLDPAARYRVRVVSISPIDFCPRKFGSKPMESFRFIPLINPGKLNPKEGRLGRAKI